MSIKPSTNKNDAARVFYTSLFVCTFWRHLLFIDSGGGGVKLEDDGWRGFLKETNFTK
jgi:hypothetical protein